MKMFVLSCLLLAIGLSSVAGAQEGSLIRAQHLEWISQQPEQAVEEYRAFLETESGSPKERAEAYVGWIRCLLKLQQLTDAEAVRDKVPATLQQQPIVGRIPALFAAYGSVEFDQVAPPSGVRIQGLIEKLGDPDQIDQVYEMLRGLGDVAVPYLIYAVHNSTDPAIVGNSMRILGKRVDDQPVNAATEFFAGIDPASEPILTVQALEHLSPPVPEALHPWLDRCAATTVLGIRSALIDFMAARDDGSGAEYLREVLNNGKEIDHRAVLQAVSNFSDEIAPEIMLAVAESPFGNVRHELAHRVSPTRYPAAWIRLCNDDSNNVRRRALEQYVRDLNDYVAAGSTLRALFKDPELEQIKKGFLDAYHAPEVDENDARRLLYSTVNGEKRTIPSDLGARRTTDGTHNYVPAARIHGYLAELPLTSEEVAGLVAKGPETYEPLTHWLARHYSEPGWRSSLLGLLDDPAYWQHFVGAMYHFISSSEWLLKSDSHRIDFCLEVLQRLERNHELRMRVAAELAEIGYSKLRHVLVELVEDNPGWYSTRGLKDLRLHLVDPAHEKTVADVARWLSDPRFADVWSLMIGDLTAELARQPQITAAIGRLLKAGEPILSLVQKKEFGIHEQALEWVAEIQGDAEEKAESLGRLILRKPGLAAKLKRAFRVTPLKPREHVFRIWSRLAQEMATTQEEREALAELFAGYLRNPAPAGIDAAVFYKYAGHTLARLHEGPLPDEWVEALLNHENRSVLSWVLEKMTQQQRQQQRGRMEALLQHPASSIRIQVMDDFLDERAAKLVAGLLDDASENVRQKALSVLASIREIREQTDYWKDLDRPPELSPLERLLQQTKDDDPQIRMAAVRSLGAMGDPEALPHLVELLRHDDPGTKQAAQAAIDRLIETANPPPEQDSKTIPDSGF